MRYAIFPEQSGILEIPAQTFSAREGQGRRGFFDLGSSGRQLSRSSKPLTIKVSPRPAVFPANTWLPARNLTLEESWSTPPEQLRAGESATRTIRIVGEGLQGAQLPPIMFPATDGLKYYPDQPVITDTEVASGLLGSRQDSAAVVPTRAGKWTIPEIRIPWWDTQSEEIRYAVLPGRELSVAAADPATTTALIAAPAIEITGTGDPVNPVAAADIRWWKILSLTSTVGWILTLGYLLWSRRTPKKNQAIAPENPAERHLFKQLLAACVTADALRVRAALIDWTAALFPHCAIVSLDQVATVFDDKELNTSLAKLNASLYSSASSDWEGAALADSVRQLRNQRKIAAANRQPALQLYPQAV